MSLENFQEKYNEAVKFFPELIKNRREYCGFTISEAARDLGVQVNQLFTWESGKNLPSLDHLIDICEYYFISFDILFRLGEFEDEKLEDIIYICPKEDNAV